MVLVSWRWSHRYGEESRSLATIRDFRDEVSRPPHSGHYLPPSEQLQACLSALCVVALRRLVGGPIGSLV